jgi:hypothetical protein
MNPRLRIGVDFEVQFMRISLFNKQIFRFQIRDFQAYYTLSFLNILLFDSSLLVFRPLVISPMNTRIEIISLTKISDNSYNYNTDAMIFLSIFTL